MKRLINYWSMFNNKINFFRLFVIVYVCVFVPSSIVLRLLSNFFPTRPISLSLLAVVFLLLLFSMPTIIKKINYRDLVFFGFFAICFLMLAIRQSFTSGIASSIKTILTSCILYFLVFRYSQEKTEYKFIALGFYIITLCLFAYSIYHKLTSSFEDMTNSYFASLSSAIVLSHVLFVNKKRWILIVGIILCVLGLVASYLFGSRGPIVLFAVYGLYLLYRKIFAKSKNKTFIAIIIILLFLFLVFFFLVLTNVLVSNGTIKQDSALVKIYLTMFSSSGRNVLYRMVFIGTKYYFPFGNGLFGDRPLTSLFIYSAEDPVNFGAIPQTFHTTYSHNIVLEFLASFGWIGSFLILSFLIIYLKNNFSRIYIEKSKLSIFLPLLFIGVFSLLLSNSFIISDYFWGFCGICLSILSSCSKKHIPAKSEFVVISI